jgi:hypothetical protein
VAISDESGHNCTGKGCAICAHNIAAGTTGKGLTGQSKPNKKPKGKRIRNGC